MVRAGATALSLPERTHRHSLEAEMKLPTSDQVMSVTRHVATFLGGAVVMFGVSTKVSPEQVAAIINSMGTLVNDFVLLCGALTPVVAAIYAAKSASITSQLKAVTTNPDVKIQGQIMAPADVAAAVPSAKVVAAPPKDGL